MPDPETPPEVSEHEALLNSYDAAAVLDAFLRNTPSGAAIVSAPDGKILRLSDYAAQVLGLSRSEMEGHTVGVAVPKNYDPSGRLLSEDEMPLTRALRGERVTGSEVWIETRDGERIPLLASAEPIRNARGDLIGVVGSFADLRPQKALERSLREALAQLEDALAQRETLYRELTHRVKNHLQIMSGLISMEARDPKLSTEGLAEVMKGRLRALAAVYDGMTLAGIGARIGAGAFFDEVCRPYASEAVKIEAVVDPHDLTLTSEQAGPIGMLVNEAVSNSYKHAFPDHLGRIWATLRLSEPGRLRLEVADDGIGWKPRDTARKSHGLELMKLFAQQLHGSLQLSDRPGGGALVAAELPEAIA